MTRKRSYEGRGRYATSSQLAGQKTQPDQITICCSQATAEGPQQAFGFTLEPQPGQRLTANPPRPNLTGPQDLLQITTGVTGSPTVSAREFHTFLQVKSKFIDWFRNRVEKYGFVEGQDFVRVTQERVTLGGEGFSKNLEKGGRPEIDYALTLDMAKELAMVQNNSQGRAARQYFIDCEKRLRAIAGAAPAPASTTDPALLQLLTRQQAQIDRLQHTVDGMLHQRPPLTQPGNPPQPVRLRQLITRQIGAYAVRTNLTLRDTYAYFYQRLLAVHGIDVFALGKPLSGSFLDALDQAGHLRCLYTLVIDETHQAEEY
ncbi:antA/AntB antirepressor family protein [Fibrella sp. HMF5405]|uniref:AntA/AntB antirepressor family protein n=2 Tax=Fibrella forsythiae TaxID=2817061 RepID=A0ABS3JVN9_9BACT|nr:antA/AntB antirepressor family protein [Fibrella forsythiae]